MDQPSAWLSKINEPFFRSKEEAEAFVSRELSSVIPEEWEIERSSNTHLDWVIRGRNPTSQEWQNQEYSVRITSGLDFVILTHGNTDVGPFGLQHALHNALVIEAVMLRRFSLAQCVEFLLRNCKPNEWGYTLVWDRYV